MRVATAFPNEPPRADWSDIAQVHERLREASDELAGMTDAVAKARQIVEYDGECRKRALALHVREFLAAGDSASAAETKGRASIGYGEGLDQLRAGFGCAQQVILKWEAVKCRWESVRSILSSLKAVSGNV